MKGNLRETLNSASQQLQRMLRRLQRYKLTTQYRKGKDTFLADILSRIPFLEVINCDFVQELEDINNKSTYQTDVMVRMTQSCVHFALLYNKDGQRVSRNCLNAQLRYTG